MSAPQPDHPNVIAKPPFIYLGFLLGSFILNVVFPLPLKYEEISMLFGTAMIVIGITIIASGFREFKKRGTNINPYEPALAIVTTGIYARSRNPMYLGLTLFYAGIAIVSDNAWAIASLIPLLIVMHYGVILREEAYLEGKFGEKYRNYKNSVRRWV